MTNSTNSSSNKRLWCLVQTFFLDRKEIDAAALCSEYSHYYDQLFQSLCKLRGLPTMSAEERQLRYMYQHMVRDFEKKKAELEAKGVVV